MFIFVSKDRESLTHAIQSYVDLFVNDRHKDEEEKEKTNYVGGAKRKQIELGKSTAERCDIVSVAFRD